MSRYPRRLNLQGGVPLLVPPTWAQAEALANAARAAGFEAVVTTDCKVVLPGQCVPVWNRHTRTSACRRADVLLMDASTLDGLAAHRQVCALSPAMVAV